MKKILSLFLAALMFCTCAPFVSAAENPVTIKDALRILPVSTMDSMDGWSGSATLDTTSPFQGTGSLGHTFESVSGAGAIKFQYKLPSGTYDISDMSYVYFDIYLSNAASLIGERFELELRSPGGTDDHEYRIQQNLGDFIVGTPQDGWNRVEVPIASMEKVGKVLTSAWCYLRFFNSSNVTIGQSGTTTTIKMDNLYFATESFTVRSADESGCVLDAATLLLDDSFNITFRAVFTNGYAPFMLLEDGTRIDGEGTTVNGTYIFPYNKIYAHRMSDVIKPTFCYLDGAGKLSFYTYEQGYSVKSYCQNILNKIESNDSSLSGYTDTQKAALKRLLSDALYYGAAAQQYASYQHTDGNLATDGVTNLLEDQAYSAPTDYIRSPLRGVKKGGTASWYGATLVLDTTIKVRFLFTSTDLSKVKVDVVTNDHSSYELTTFSTLSNENGTFYYFEVPVPAHCYDQEISVSFEDYHESRVSYSVNTYIAKNYKADGSRLSELLSAINNYGNAAKTYVSTFNAESEGSMSYYEFTEADRALFENSYNGFADRVRENGYAQTSVTGAYSGEFMRDAACQLRAHLANGDYDLVKRMLQYIVGYHKADGVPYARHIIDNLQTSATYDYIATKTGAADTSDYIQATYPTALFRIQPDTNACAQKFRVPVDSISGISVYLKNIPSDGQLILELSATAPAQGSTTVAFTQPIASVTLECKDVSVKNGWTAFAFEDDVTVTPNQYYYFAVRLENSTTNANAYGLNVAPGSAFNFDKKWQGQHASATLAYEVHFGGEDAAFMSQTKVTNQASWIKTTTHAAAQSFVATTETISAISVCIDSPAGLNADGSARSGALTLSITKTDPLTYTGTTIPDIIASTTLSIDKINPTTDRGRNLWTKFSFGIPVELTEGETYYFTVTQTEDLTGGETNVFQLYGNTQISGDYGSYTFDKKWALKTFEFGYVLYEPIQIELIYKYENMPIMGIHNIRQESGNNTLGGGGSAFVAKSEYLSAIEVYLRGADSSVGTVTLWVGDVAPSGSNVNAPFSTPLATKTLNLKDVKTGWIKFAFDELVPTTPDQTYYFVLTASSDAANKIFTVGATNQGDDAMAYTYNKGWSKHKEHNIAHRIYGDAPDLYSSFVTLGGGVVASQTVDSSMNGRYVTCADLYLSRVGEASANDTFTVSLYKGNVLVDELTRPLSSLKDEKSLVHYEFCLPILDTNASDAYTVRVSASKDASVKWYGISGADTTHPATLDGVMQDVLLSLIIGSIQDIRIVDKKIQVDGHYQLLDAYAMFALECYDEYPKFIEITYDMMKDYANYFFDPANTYVRKNYTADKVYEVVGEFSYSDPDMMGGLILNPCLEHSREGSYWEGYDLITNVFAAESTNKMSQVATMLGKTEDAMAFKQKADSLSAAINKYMVANFEGEKIYIELITLSTIKPGDVDYVYRDWETTYGFSFVSLSPVASNWYAVDDEIMANTYDAYIGHSLEVYKISSDGSQYVIRPSVCTLDDENRTTKLHSHIIGKDIAWEIYYMYKTGNTERLEHLMDFLAKASVSGSYAETYSRNGKLSDVGNQEQTGWLLYEIARIAGIYEK